MIMIGLEIHGYLYSREKLFCRCPIPSKSDFPNFCICPICTGQPGSKPMAPNKEAIKKIITISLILGCKVNTYDNGKVLVWQRKHYDWPDLPKGYQDTLSGSYAIPVAENGKFEGIRIKEVHLEEDPAAWNPETGEIDYNRSGIPLVEIVTEPDFKSSEEVEEWLRNLLLTLSYAKVINKKSGIKADVNISIKGVSERTEIKNVNSISEIKKVIEYEIERHEKEKPNNKETRRWDSKKQVTLVMRQKENQDDYRFISDPDLPAIKIFEKEVRTIKDSIPPTPKEKLNMIIKRYSISKKDAIVLTKNLELVEFFEEVSKKVEPSFALPWITVELLRVLNYNKVSLDDVDINPEHFIELLINVKDKKITELKAKQILNSFIPSSFSIRESLSEVSKIGDVSAIKNLCKNIIIENKKACDDFRSGKKEALDFLVGQVMKSSNKRADYKVVKKVLLDLLEE
ncbi:MAG: Asp-tRNA(Asn)/Glu-tRNA(Gln) amidotransferase subunit GatB [Candidatus Pacearchaeota archaeon]